MTNKATGPFLRALAFRMEKACKDIEFIGRDGKPYKRDYEADARWYCAYHIASDMAGDYRAKDWAHVVLDGMEPLTDQDVKDHFYEPSMNGECRLMPNEDELRKWLHG